MTSDAIFSPEAMLAEHERSFKPKRALPRGVREALHLSYLASLETEEGRPVRFALVMADDASDLPHLLPLATPEKLTLELLRRFSPAVDGHRSCLVAGGQDPSGLQLRGFCSRPHVDDWTLEHELPNAVIFARGPGRVDLQFLGAVTRYERGQARTLTPAREVLDRFPARFMTWHIDFAGRIVETGPMPEVNVGLMTHGCKRDVSAELRDHLLWSAQVVVPGVLLDWLGLIITNIHRLGHGAGLLVVPIGHDDRSFRSAGREVLPSPKPYVNAWNDGLLRATCWNTHYDLSRADECVMWLVPEQKDAAHRWGNERGMQEVRTAHDSMMRDANRIARLTQVDGALVLDYSFTPLIVGATLREGPSAGAVVGGHRRKAMRSAVGNVPHSFGLLISQDGGVDLISRDAADAVVELEIAL